jgi:hypothetical protein
MALAATEAVRPRRLMDIEGRQRVFERRSGGRVSVKEEAVAISPKLLTVDQAGRLWGLSQHAIVELIASGQLTWTLAAGKKTVMVEVPSDPEQFSRVIGASAESSDAGHHLPPAAQPDSRVNTRLSTGDRPTITDLDAWSQPK